MPSMKCYHCGKVRPCIMRLADGRIDYLCRRCTRELSPDEGGEA